MVENDPFPIVDAIAPTIHIAPIFRTRRVKNLGFNKRCQGIRSLDALHVKDVMSYLQLLDSIDLNTCTAQMTRKIMLAKKYCAQRYLDVVRMPGYIRPPLVRKNSKISELEPSIIPETYRFTTSDQLLRLKAAFHIGDVITLNNGCKLTGDTFLLMGIYRLKFPVRECDLQSYFGVELSIVSRALTQFYSFMTQRWGYLLFDHVSFWKPYFPQCAEAIREFLLQKHNLVFRAADMEGGFSVFGFIDNTLNPTCRPGSGPNGDGPNAPRYNREIQEAFYTGWKKLNGMKYQTVNLPNGMIMHAYGGVSIRHNDSWSLRMSDINGIVSRAQEGSPVQYIMYGDSAYTWMSHLKSRYVAALGDNLTQRERDEDIAMSSVRESIEWDYGRIKSLWKTIDYKKMLRIGDGLVSDIFITAMLFPNAHCTMNGSQTTSYFNLMPPTLEEWTHLGPQF